MNRPLVSVVTPCRNAAQFVRATIESVRSQDYPNIEHIVMDGDSTDGTQQILGEYSHLKWVSEPDRGQSHALNKALHRCTGDIVGWLNADDTYQPGSVRAAVDFLTQHPDIDAVYTDVLVVDRDGKALRLRKSEPFSLERLLFANFIKQPTLFMRKAVLDSIGDAREDLHYVMDWELWIRAATKCRFSYLEGQVFAHFRRCPGTKTAEHAPKFAAEHVLVLQDLLKLSPDLNLPQSLVMRAIKRAKAQVILIKFFSGEDPGGWWQHSRLLLNAILQDPSLSFSLGLWQRSLKRLLFYTRSFPPAGGKAQFPEKRE